MRTRVYNSIVDWLSDCDWHELREIEHVTGFPEQWVRELEGDPRFDVDASEGRVRLVDVPERVTA